MTPLNALDLAARHQHQLATEIAADRRRTKRARRAPTLRLRTRTQTAATAA